MTILSIQKQRQVNHCTQSYVFWVPDDTSRTKGGSTFLGQFYFSFILNKSVQMNLGSSQDSLGNFGKKKNKGRWSRTLPPVLTETITDLIENRSWRQHIEQSSKTNILQKKKVPCESTSKSMCGQREGKWQSWAHFLCELPHAFIARSSSIIQEQRSLPVVIVGLQQVPGVVTSSQIPHIHSFVSGPCDDASLIRKISNSACASITQWRNSYIIK